MGEHTKWKGGCVRQKKEYIFQSCMELGSFPIQFPIHNGLACLCAKAQTKLFFMSIRDNCVRRWLSVALTWEILNLNSLQLLPHRPPVWLFLKPSAPFLSHDANKLTGFTPLYRHTLACAGYYCILWDGKFEGWQKTWGPTFSIIGNFVSILSAHLSHSFILCFPISSSVILLHVCVDGLSDFLNSSSPSKAGHISFEEWQAHSRRDQSNAKLKFKRKLKSM